MLPQIWLYTLISVFLVSIISLVGILSIKFNSKKLKKFLIYLISLSAGTLLGDAFLHLLPETLKSIPVSTISIFTLLGITIFFFMEKIIRWQHCHGEILEENHIHPFAFMNIVGDSLHNFLDGIIIASSYLISLPAGIATTIAVVLHEIPQEIGDFGVLLHGGFTKSKALAVNFVSAVFAIFGAVLTLILKNSITNIESFLVPIAIGGFIYIAGSDLIPEIHKHSEKFSKALTQILFFIIGIGLMYILLFLE